MKRQFVGHHILVTAGVVLVLTLVLGATAALAQGTSRDQQAALTRGMKASSARYQAQADYLRTRRTRATWEARYQGLADRARTTRTAELWGVRYAKLASQYQSVRGNADASIPMSTLKWMNASRARYQGLAEAHRNARRMQAWTARYQALADAYSVVEAHR